MHLFGILKVFKECFLRPYYTLVDVGGGIAEAFSLTRLTTKDSDVCSICLAAPRAISIQ